jgi:hypothetical protein
MTDQFTEVTTKGFGQRILGSVIGIPIGLLLVAVGIGVLYWNEGRFDLSMLAKNAVEIQATQQAPSDAQGKIVAVKGNVTSNEQLGDTFLNPGSYLALKRTTEEYAWVEKSESQSQGNTGGSETTTTTYTYNTQWTENVADSANFKHREGHSNPPKTVPSETKRVSHASLGNYLLDFNSIDLPQFSQVALSAANTILTPGFTLTGDNNLYKGANYATPQVGDIKINYSSVNNNFAGTAIGKLNGNSLESFVDAKNHRLYRLFTGSKQDALTTLHNEYRTKLWLFRGGGFLAVFIGLTMLLGPVTTLLSFFPTLGRIGSAAVATIAFPVALLLSGVTIIVGMIAHNPLVLTLALVLTTAASVYYIRMRSHKVAKTGPTVTSTTEL